MRTKVLLVCLISVAALLAAGAASAAGKMPGADAAELWNYITKTSPYQKWGHWSDWKGVQPSKSPHGAFTAIYANKQALKAKKTPLPVGALVVKEGYTQDKKLDGLVVMYKVKGFNPEAGDWFWAFYSPDGQVKASGKPEPCIKCHQTAAANDYLAAHKFKK